MQSITPEALARGNETTKEICRRLVEKGFEVETYKGYSDWLQIRAAGYCLGCGVGGTARCGGPSGKLAVKFQVLDQHLGTAIRWFPEPKKGFDLDKLVNRITEYLDVVKKRRIEMEAKQERYRKSHEIASQLRKDYDVYKCRVKGSSWGLVLEFEGISQEKAAALLKLAQEIGL